MQTYLILVNAGYVRYLISKSSQLLTYKLYTSDQVYLVYLTLAASGAKSTTSAKNVSRNARHASYLDCCFWFLILDSDVMICSELILPSAA